LYDFDSDGVYEENHGYVPINIYSSTLAYGEDLNKPEIKCVKWEPWNFVALDNTTLEPLWELYSFWEYWSIASPPIDGSDTPYFTPAID
jgi:hypothetical protein